MPRDAIHSRVLALAQPTQPLQVSESAVVSSFVDSVARGGVMRELVRLGELTLVHHDC